MAKSKKLIRDEIIDTLINSDLTKEDLTRVLDFIKEKEYREVSIANVFANEEFISNVCLSYRHDFGLLDDAKKASTIFECQEWMRAITNNLIYF